MISRSDRKCIGESAYQVISQGRTEVHHNGGNMLAVSDLAVAKVKEYLNSFQQQLKDY